jgi:hypothetical protein
LAGPQDEDLERLFRMTLLTPGDFAAVMRQGRFRPVLSCSAMVSALEAECAVKHCNSSAIGFLA